MQHEERRSARLGQVLVVPFLVVLRIQAQEPLLLGLAIAVLQQDGQKFQRVTLRRGRPAGVGTHPVQLGPFPPFVRS